jgi:integrase
MAIANPGMRLWILLCSDLAIRSGTAAGLGGKHYDHETRTLRFTTKCGARMALPVTAEIEQAIARCDLHSTVPFVRQLWTPGRQRGRRGVTKAIDTGETPRMTLRRLLKQAGITRRITAHDMRRATAVAVLDHTKDIREVQAVLGHTNLKSTLHYLDHDLRPVKRSLLETIKRPSWAEKRQA